MRYYPIKQIHFIALLILSAIFFITACKPKSIPPNTSATTGKNGDSTIVAVDSLPTFYSPAAVAVDAAGNVYVADYGNNLIRKITPGGLVSTLAGTGMQGSINETGTLASFNQPSGIAVDASGSVFVADAGNNLIRKITPAGVVSTVAGQDSTGSQNGAGAIASFFDPASLTLDGAGNIYVADAGNNLVRVINQSVTVSTLAGNGTDTTLTALFDNPTGIAADTKGNIFIANYLNNNILKITSAGAVSIFAGTGLTGAANGPGNAATFYFPNSVATDAADNVYVSDGVNNLIRKITPDGIVSTFAGSGTAGAVDSTGMAASFNGPAGLAIDATGNVYVADAGNNLIRKITQAGVVTTIAGNGMSGAKNGQAVARSNKKTIKMAAKKQLHIFYRRKQ